MFGVGKFLRMAGICELRPGNGMGGSAFSRLYFDDTNILASQVHSSQGPPAEFDP